MMRPDTHTFFSSGLPSARSGLPSENPSYPFIGISCISGNSRSTHAMICSFSSGEKVQVEIDHHAARFQHGDRLFYDLSLHFLHIPAVFFTPDACRLRIFAEHAFPEHGASTRILSKYAGNCSAIFAGTSFKRKEFGIPITSMFFRSAFTLEALMSFATRSPSQTVLPPVPWLLPPGAAQRSSTRSPDLPGVLRQSSSHSAPEYNKAPHNSTGVWSVHLPLHNKIHFPPTESVSDEKAPVL